MKLFISYPSQQRALAESLRLALEGEGHDVFTDRADLDAGESFHGELREAVEDCDAFVFLITPHAVAAGSYTLTELGFAQNRWRHPSGHVLPVMVEPTPIASLPAYLRAVTLLQPQGDLVAETVAAVAQLSQPQRSRRRLATGVAVLVAVAVVVAGVGWWQLHQKAQQEQRAQQAIEQAAQAAQQQAGAALEQCKEGNPQLGWEALRALAAKHAGTPVIHTPVKLAWQDCGLHWLRNMRSIEGQNTFGAQVDVIQPVLLEGIANAAPARAATLRAHLGWGEHLRSRDGTLAADPTPQYRAALAMDPNNAHAHAMWGHWLMSSHTRDHVAARDHFEQALKSGVDRTWVRQLQWGAATWSGNTRSYALEVLNQMRRAGESLSDRQRRWLWGEIYTSGLNSPESRERLLAGLPATEWVPLFVWTHPSPPESGRATLIWRFWRVAVQRHAGDSEAARAELLLLERELAAVADSADGRVARSIGELKR
jgi:hypothetical protein